MDEAEEELRDTSGKEGRQLSSASTALPLEGDLHELLARQCAAIDTEIETAVAQILREDRRMSREAREVASECAFCATAADPSHPDVVMVAVSNEFEAMTGFFRSEVLGTNCRFLNYGCETEHVDWAGLRAACQTGAPFRAAIRNRRKSGELFWNLLDIRGLTVAENPQTGAELWFVLGLQADVTRFVLDCTPEQPFPDLSPILDGIRARLSQRLGTLAMTGALAMASGARGLGIKPGDAAWCPLPEPRWHNAGREGGGGACGDEPGTSGSLEEEEWHEADLVQ